MTDRQLPLEPTIRIDPTTLVEHMPGTDAICLCTPGAAVYTNECLWPWCAWKDHINDEEDA